MNVLYVNIFISNCVDGKKSQLFKTILIYLVIWGKNSTDQPAGNTDTMHVSDETHTTSSGVTSCFLCFW